MALTTSSTQLGCGRDIDQVWDHLDRAPDPHELTCPYCQAARADLAGLAEATRQLRVDDATNPDLQPGPAVLDRILAVARAEVRRGRRLPLDQPDSDGTTPNTVSEQAVTTVVRRVGDRTADIQIRRCSIATISPVGTGSVPAPSGDADAAGSVGALLAGPLEASPAAVAVSLRVSVAHDLPIVRATVQLRSAVVEAVDQEIGIDVTSVDIHVEDVHDA